MSKKKRIIITSYDIPEDVALEYVRAVIVKGKISDSGRQYCYLTKFHDGTVVAGDRRESDSYETFSFKVYQEG